MPAGMVVLSAGRQVRVPAVPAAFDQVGGDAVGLADLTEPELLRLAAQWTAELLHAGERARRGKGVGHGVRA